MFNNRHIPADDDAIYDELQSLDYLNEWTPAQHARVEFLNELLQDGRN